MLCRKNSSFGARTTGLGSRVARSWELTCLIRFEVTASRTAVHLSMIDTSGDGGPSGLHVHLYFGFGWLNSPGALRRREMSYEAIAKYPLLRTVAKYPLLRTGEHLGVLIHDWIGVDRYSLVGRGGWRVKPWSSGMIRRDVTATSGTRSAASRPRGPTASTAQKHHRTSARCHSNGETCPTRSTQSLR